MSLKTPVWCPGCHESSLKECELEANLPSSICTKCGGTWLSAECYEKWLKTATHSMASALSPSARSLVPESSTPDITLCATEKSGPKLCPDCNYILLGYRVGHGLDFSLNRCAHFGGIWFDQNEWATLKARNLHDNVHLVFSKSWQDAIREEEHQQAMNAIWLDHLGERDYNEIQRVKKWLRDHPKSGELYAFLLADRFDNRNS